MSTIGDTYQPQKGQISRIRNLLLYLTVDGDDDVAVVVGAVVAVDHGSVGSWPSQRAKPLSSVADEVVPALSYVSRVKLQDELKEKLIKNWKYKER